MSLYRVQIAKARGISSRSASDATHQKKARWEELAGEGGFITALSTDQQHEEILGV